MRRKELAENVKAIKRQKRTKKQKLKKSRCGVDLHNLIVSLKTIKKPKRGQKNV